MKHQQGQSLVEMVVVIGMVVLLATGIVAGTTAALSHSATSQTRSQALSYAQAGIELARGTRDSGWQNLVNGTTVTTIGPYTRSVTFLLINVYGVQTMKVTSRVTWGDTTNPSNAVQLITYLTQWK